jgi:predicted ribosomally synthesized peptide with SipW-like signal peptide
MFERPISLLSGCVLAAGGAFALSAPQTFAAFTSSAEVAGNSVEAGGLDVLLVDAAGTPLSAPIVSVANAQPAMTTKTFTVRVKNGGSLPGTVELHTAGLVDGTAASLDDVLVATVKNAGGTTLFSGKVSALSVVLASLAAGDTAVLTLELTWPDLPGVDDNPYQEASLSFSLVADSSQLIA